MSVDMHIKVLDILMDKTRAGRQEWSEGPLTNSFFTQVGANGISLRKSGEDYHLIIHDSEGNVVDNVSDPVLKAKGFDKAYSFMGELYDMAQRNAYGSDKILQDILKELQK